MAIRIANALIQSMRNHSAQAYPEECCGILLGRDGDPKDVIKIMPAKNVHEASKRNRYTVDPAELLKAEVDARASGLAVLGFYHSHPDAPARPSSYDRELAWPYYSYLILSVIGGTPSELAAWTLRTDTNGFDSERLLIERQDSP